MARPSHVAIAVLAVILASSGVYFFSPSILPTAPKVHAASLSIVLVGTISAWNASTNPNPTITVHQGDTINLKLSSGDGVTHLFLLDADNDGSGTADCPATDPCSAFFSSSTPITYSFTASFPAGTYTYYCAVHPTTMLGSFVILGRPDYTISATPGSLSLGQGNSSSSTVTVASVMGFTGPVSLSTGVSPAGPTASISPSSLIVPSNGNTMAKLNVSATPSTPVGSYTITVTASNATTSRSVMILATVTQTITFKAIMRFSGTNMTISGRFAVNTTIRQLTGSTSLTVINATTGAPIYSKNISFTLTYNTLGTVQFLDDIPASPYWLASDCSVNVPANSVSCFPSRTPDITHGGSVNIVDIGIVNLQYGQTVGSPNYNPAANLTASGQITIVDIGIVDRYYAATVFLPP